MPCGEVQASDDRSLDGGGEGCDGQSVSTLDIADAATSRKTPDEARSPKDNTLSGKEWRESVTSLQVEDTDQETLAGKCMKNFQCDMKFCTIAFLAVSLVFVLIIMLLCFTQPKTRIITSDDLTVPLMTTTSSNIE